MVLLSYGGNYPKGNCPDTHRDTDFMKGTAHDWKNSDRTSEILVNL